MADSRIFTEVFQTLDGQAEALQGSDGSRVVRISFKTPFGPVRFEGAPAESAALRARLAAAERALAPTGWAALRRVAARWLRSRR